MSASIESHELIHIATSSRANGSALNFSPDLEMSIVRQVNGFVMLNASFPRRRVAFKVVEYVPVGSLLAIVDRQYL